MTRHTAAVLHLAAGENPIFISRLLGHSSGELLFRRYAPFVPNALGGDGAGAGEAGGVTSGVSSLRMHTNPHLWWLFSVAIDWETPMARLMIDMTNQEHQALKAMAALEGKTIKQFTLERLFSVDSSGSEALEPIKALLAERVAQAQRGELADGSVMEIAERAVQSSGK